MSSVTSQFLMHKQRSTQKSQIWIPLHIPGICSEIKPIILLSHVHLESFHCTRSDEGIGAVCRHCVTGLSMIPCSYGSPFGVKWVVCSRHLAVSIVSTGPHGLLLHSVHHLLGGTGPVHQERFCRAKWVSTQMLGKGRCSPRRGGGGRRWRQGRRSAGVCSGGCDDVAEPLFRFWKLSACEDSGYWSRCSRITARECKQNILPHCLRANY